MVDPVGGVTQARPFAVRKRGGVLASVVSAPDAALAVSHEIQAKFFLGSFNTARLTRLTDIIDATRPKTNVGTILPLACARLAHDTLEGTRSRHAARSCLRLRADRTPPRTSLLRSGCDLIPAGVSGGRRCEAKPGFSTSTNA